MKPGMDAFDDPAAGAIVRVAAPLGFLALAQDAPGSCQQPVDGHGTMALVDYKAGCKIVFGGQGSTDKEPRA